MPPEKVPFIRRTRPRTRLAGCLGRIGVAEIAQSLVVGRRVAHVVGVGDHLDLVAEFRQEAQLIIVSHQKRTMEIADALYGVTMQEPGVSRIVEVDIEAALTAKVGILTNNTNIQPGASVPFMAVFFQTPDTVEEFGLEVIHSSVPQQ